MAKKAKLSKAMKGVLHMLVGLEEIQPLEPYLRHDGNQWWVCWVNVHPNTARGLVQRKFITKRLKTKDRIQLYRITLAGRKALKEQGHG